MPNYRKLSPRELELMRPLQEIIDNLYSAQLLAPTISNGIASTLCTGAVKSIVLAVLMSERHSGPDKKLRADQLDFLIAQISEAYTAEIARIEEHREGLHRAMDAAAAIRKGFE